MYCDLKTIKKELGLTRIELSEALNVSSPTITKWTQTSQIPQHAYYMLCEIYPDFFKLPSDFFHYTGKILGLNMKYYSVSGEMLYKKMNIGTNKFYRLLDENMNFYDWKDSIQEVFGSRYFIPFVRTTEGQPCKFTTCASKGWKPLVDKTFENRVKEKGERMLNK